MPRWKELPEELDPQIRDFAEHMRRLVDRSGLTVSEVADRTGYSRSSWDRYLNGRLMPSRESVVAFAEVTGARDDQLMAEWGAADRAWSRAELRQQAALQALRAAEPAAGAEDEPEPDGRQGRGLRGVLGLGGRGKSRPERREPDPGPPSRPAPPGAPGAIPRPGATPGPGAAPGSGAIPGSAGVRRTEGGARGDAPARPGDAARPGTPAPRAEKSAPPDATERSAVRPGPPPPPERRARAEELPGRRSTGTGTSAAGADPGTDGAGAARDPEETAKLRALSRPAPAAAPDPERAGEPREPGTPGSSGTPTAAGSASSASAASGSAASSASPPAAASAAEPLVTAARSSSRPAPAKSWPLRRVLLAALVTLLLTGSGAGVVYVAHGLLTDPGMEEQEEPRGGPPPASSPAGSPSESLPEGVRCRGDDCAGEDPEKMGCGGGHARTTSRKYVGAMLLEIRYSEPCRAAWARITSAEPGSTVTALAEAPGAEPTRQDSSAGNSEGYTPMVPAEKLKTVRACAALPDGTADCTKGSPPP